ncbi:type II toxin-antitoxin system VapC family toxin [Rhodoplanes sp. SY1]|uniref:type II toxin-antitoxin system VapC family toxin n=1 Tax=Rhodoplanes sp. SY1 TaxID=3166646 RepID=UPI0038B58191
MIAVDSSAFVAILEAEPDAADFAAAIADADRLLVSTVNVHETAIVLRARRGPQAVARFWRFLRVENDFVIVPFDETQLRAAVAAFDRFGKGIHPNARLNLADCAAYALAFTMAVPLLFKGDDFAHTDVIRVVT